MKNIICQICNKTFQVKNYREKSAKYCSMECRGKALVGQAPANKGRVKNRVDFTCQNCGKKFSRIASRANHGRGKHCSPECQHITKKSKPKKEMIFNCLNCGVEFRLPISKYNQHKGSGKYCSRKCRDDHRIMNNHPSFINGENSNWQRFPTRRLSGT